LTQGGRARPWMQLRMPQYGEANVGSLPESLALLEGTAPDDTVRKVTLTTAKVEAGKTIIGKGGLGCISCHDISGIPNTGTRGGNPAKLLGPKFWVAPPGHPWGLTANPRLPPDFLGRANSPAFGVPLPLEPARVYDGPTAVHFDGYSLDRSGRPTFRYTLTEG